MGKYSELIGSFIRTGNFPMEANFIFYSEAELKEFYQIPENKETLHRGWMKIVVDQETGLQSLWWVTKKQTNDELEFTKLIDATSIEDLKEALDDLEKRLEQEIQDRIDGDNAIWGTENPTIIPEDLNSILDLANAVTEIRAILEEHKEAIELLRKQLKATVGTEEDDIIAYLQTLDYKSLTEVSEALHKWLEEYDAENEKINTLPELQAFLEGFTDRDTLLQILTDLWYNIQGSPLPSEEFRTLRGIEDFVRVFKAEIEHQADNIQTELDQTQVGVGLSADGSYSPDQETYYLKDSTSVMNALKTLDWYINEAIKYCRIRPTDTNTIDLTVNHYDEYNEILGEVKISKEDGNGIIVKEDGLYHKVRTEYSTDGILTLRVNDEIVAQHNLGLSYIGIQSAYYDTATEDLVIVFEKEDTSTEELRIPVYSLIREWTVNNTHPTDVVVLTRKEVLGGAPDELSADVRLFDDKYNILVKVGNTLYVKGTSSNIIHDGDVTVETKLNELDTRVTTLENKSDDLEQRLEQEIQDRKDADEALQEQITSNDTDIANLQSELDATQAGAGLDVTGAYVPNEQSSYLKEATSLHDATQKLDNALQAESDRAVARENEIESNLNKEIERSIAAETDLQNQINSNDTDIENLQKELDATQAGSGLNLDGTYSPNAQSAYLKEATSLYDATQKLDVALKEESDRAKETEENLQEQITELKENTTVEVIDTNTVDLTKTIEEVGYSIKADVKIDSNDAANIIITNANGLTAAVDLTYDRESNVLTFTTTGNQSKTIQLSTHSLVDSITYDPSIESIIFIYSVDGVQQEPVLVPVHNLIQEWTVNNPPESPIQLSKKIIAGEGKDELSAYVEISVDEDNILINQNGALKVSNIQIELNKANIEALQNQLNSVSDKLDAEIERSKEADDSLEEALTEETNRAKLAEQGLADALAREELRATNAESVLKQDIANTNTLLQSEINRSTLEDQHLKTQIETETDRAKEAEQNLKNSILEEVNRAELAEQELSAQIKANSDLDQVLKDRVLVNEEALNNEITRSVAKDEELSTMIIAEKDRAIASETNIQQQLTTEIARAQRAEQQLTEDLNDEITRATHAEEVLMIKLEEEVDRATAVEEDLQNQINDLKNAQDEALEEAVTELENMIQAETDRAKAAEQDLQNQINDNVAKDEEQDEALAKKIEKVELVKEADLQYTLYVDGEAAGTVVIPEDQFLKSVDYDQLTQTLTFVFDTGAGEATTKINVSDLVDLYYAGHGLKLSDTNVFELVIDPTSETFLSVSANGLKLNGVQAAIDSAVKAETDRAIAVETELQRQITENTNNIASTSEKLDKEIERSVNKDAELEDAIAAEKARAELAEATLQNNINNEKVRAEAAELQLTTNLNNEIARAKESEQAITDRINIIETVTLVELTNKVDEEIQRSKDKDSALEKLIQDETNRATAAETQLSNDLAAETARAEAADQILENNITIEKNRAEAAEKNLSDRIDALTTTSNTEISDLKTALNNEITRSTEKDNELTTKLTEETNRAQIAEQNVLNIVNNEITRSTEKDTFLETTINNEVTRAKEVENTLNTAITNEVNRATTVENNLQEQINNLKEGNQDQIDDIVDKNEEQDRELAKKIESVIVTKISDLQYDVLVDGTSVGKIDIPEDQFLRNVIYDPDKKVLEFTFNTSEDVDKVITINISDLIDTYLAGDGLRLAQNTFHINLDPTNESFLTVGPNGLKLSGVQNAIDTAVETERNRALEAERLLQQQIDTNTNNISNVSNRLEEKINEFTQKDLELQNQITSEINRAKLVEQDLQNQITNEVNRSTSVDEILRTDITNLTSKLDTEIQRSTQTDIELQRQIDNEVQRATNIENVIKTDLQNQITNEVNRAITEEKRLETLITNETNRATEKETELLERIQEIENTSSTDVTNIQNEITEIIKKNEEQDAELDKKIESVEVVKNSDLSYSVLVDGVKTGDITIPEDQYLKDVTYSTATKEMTFTFDTGADTKTIIISLMDLITDTTYTAGAGLALRDKQFRAVIDPGSESYLTVGDNGIKLSGIDTAIGNESNRAITAENTILSQLNSEVNRATVEEGRLWDAIEDNTDLINAETTRAKEIEVNLQNQIDNINNSIGGNVVNELNEIKQNITNIEGDIENIENRLDTLEDDLDDHIKDYNNPHKVTKAQVGLDKVDNTSDMEKPISVAVQEALNNIKLEATNYATKEQLDDHKNDRNNPHNVTALQIGLGNVNNTSDADKPVSLATQQALDKKADINHDHTMADITDLENFPVVSGFITSVDELPSTAAGGTKYIKSNNGKYVLYEFDGGAGVWDEKIITSGMAASVIGGNMYKLNPAGSAYVRPERVLDESDYKETYDRIWNETKDLIQSIEWEENDATADSNGQIRLKITTKKAYAAPVADENGNAVQPNVQPKVTYIDIDKTRFLKSAYSRPATQADVNNGYATDVGVPVIVFEMTTGDEVVIDLSQTMNIYEPTDTNSIDMTVSDWTGTDETSYKISAAVKRNTTEDVKDAVEIVETTSGLTANLTVKDTASINLTNDTKANGGLRADLIIDDAINNVSGIKLSVGASGLSATMVWGDYD